MISLNEAVKNGISRLRRPEWANREDYIEIDLLGDGLHGPWVHLYSPMNEDIHGTNPVDLMCTGFDWDEVGYEIWEGKALIGFVKKALTEKQP